MTSPTAPVPVIGGKVRAPNAVYSGSRLIPAGTEGEIRTVAEGHPVYGYNRDGASISSRRWQAEARPGQWTIGVRWTLPDGSIAGTEHRGWELGF